MKRLLRRWFTASEAHSDSAGAHPQPASDLGSRSENGNDGGRSPKAADLTHRAIAESGLPDKGEVTQPDVDAAPRFSSNGSPNIQRSGPERGTDQTQQFLEASLLDAQNENQALNDRAALLLRDLESANRTLDGVQSQLAVTTAKQTDLSLELREVRQQLKASRLAAAEKQKKLADSLRTTREKLKGTVQLWNGAKPYFSLFRQGLLYDEIEKSDIDFSADAYLSLLPSTVPAALTLQHRFGGRVVCDCVENVEVERHSLAPNVKRTALSMINSSAYGSLMQSDALMTVSDSVARTLHRFGRPVRVQPNYRRYEVPSQRADIRARFGLPSNSKVLLTSGNVVEGFETVVDAMALLPENFHLVALVRLSPVSYAERVHAYVASRGLSNRVHIVGFVPYDELTGLLADADLGIITLDPANPNHSVSLPNRVFDFVTAGLPFIVPPLRDIREFVEKHQCGVALEEVTPEAWAEAIVSIVPQLPYYRERVRVAREVVTWESLDDGLIEYLGHPKTVTMLGFRDLSRYQRFLRTADSLSQRGVHVKAIFFSEDPQPVNIPNTEFYYFSERYGRGPGLTRVPNNSVGRALDDQTD